MYSDELRFCHFIILIHNDKKGPDVTQADALSKLPLTENEVPSYAEENCFSKIRENSLSTNEVAKPTGKFIIFNHTEIYC